MTPIVTALPRPIALLQRAIQSIRPHFWLLRNVATCTMGTKEMVLDRATTPPSPVSITQIRSIRDPIVWLIQKIWLSHQYAREFYSLHGLLFFTSGAAGLYGGYFHRAAAIAISEGAFVLANLVALKYHITLYRYTTDSSEKKSALLGILSNVGYIISQAMLLIGFHATLALVVCCLALTMGGIKIFYDILRSRTTSSKCG
jgi:hypothetical protein